MCVFVDNGLLRKGEAEEVMNTFKENMNLNVIKSDSEEVFLRHLKGVADPEQKRKIIGRTFIDVFDAEATKLKDVHFLAQGTIYPDVIESSGSESKEARVIKSHHNVGGLPEEMKMELVEPLRDLFKDEVRRMGVELGLSPEMLNRHPFPGPGLGVRILGDITKDKTSILKEASFRIDVLSFVISPRILTPSPGPGNGCLFSISGERPNSTPILLTSSLNKSLNGSTNSIFISSGRPPTL